jgi:uncharacterized protein YndB with AHSA1/START domain
MNKETRTSRIIKALPEELYEAFINSDELLAWLPPAEMTGVIHEFDARVGGGYRMSLFYPPDERIFRGKTSDKEDMVNVRFVELAPPHRIIQAVSFVSTDPSFFGEMTMTATFEEVSGGTEVTLAFKNLPPGLREEDNDTGAKLSLEQLARSTLPHGLVSLPKNLIKMLVDGIVFGKASEHLPTSLACNEVRRFQSRTLLPLPD